MKLTKIISIAAVTEMATVITVAEAVAGTGWPLVTMRQMDSTCFTVGDMKALIAINARHPGSCDEYWLAEAYPYAQTTAVRRATALGTYAEPLKRAGIVAGFQQGVTLGHDFSRVPVGGIVFSDAAYQVDVDGKRTAWRPYLKRLSDLAPKTHLGGVARRMDPNLMTSRANTLSSQLANAQPRRNEADVRLALMGVPVTVEESGTRSFYDPSSVPGGNYTTAQRAALLDVLDALPGGPVCVRVEKVHPLLVYPRVDARGRTVAVTFLNVSIGCATRIPVRLRRPSGARLALARPCADDVVLGAERGTGDEVAFVLPDLPAWSMATVFCHD